MSRVDARAKTVGQTRYVADVSLPDMVHVAIVRSTAAHARILDIDTTAARSADGVVCVLTAKDVSDLPYGRAVRDVPILARDKVRFVGERVAVVAAATRGQAEAAAALIDVSYEELQPVTTAEEALAPGAPLVHDAPWEYPKAYVKQGDGPNLQSIIRQGSAESADAALSKAAYVVDETYCTQAVHQGYLEPHASAVSIDGSGAISVWHTTKSPYSLRNQVADCLAVDPATIEVQPIALGGDFGGKGSPAEVPVLVEVARRCGRPAKYVQRYSDDLTAMNPRHPARVRIRLGCDEDGNITGLRVDALYDGGAYAGYKPNPAAALHGALEVGAYRIPAYYGESRTAYTTTVPKGYMRAPGAPQLNFAFESALDEIAHRLGMSPVELRRRNLLRTGETDPNGHAWTEYRGVETLDAVIGALDEVDAPAGWLRGTGVSIYNRATPDAASTSLRLVPLEGALRVEVPHQETGAGMHTVMRELISTELGFAPEDVEIVQVSTDALSKDTGAGASRVTAGIALAVDAAAKAWQNRLSDSPIVIEVEEPSRRSVGSFTVQAAQVAVDPETGELRVLEILTAVDVAEIINPVAHQMQIDGGTVMGFGFACLEDLEADGGQIWAANLGDYKLPSQVNLPRLRTVFVPGAIGVGSANVKNIGESTTPPTAAAIANAVFAATGSRIRELPLTSERIFAALRSLGADDPRAPGTAST